MRDLFLRESQNRPLLLVLEDLHWIDKTSEEFLAYLIDWMPKSPILLLLLYRPEYTHSWGSKSYYSKIGLDQLPLTSSAELVQALLAEGEVASDLRQLILDRAAGNPLFLEELTHSLLENGSIQKQDHQYVLSRTPSEIPVPDTIQGVISARMDRLEETLKRIMQVASVIGRDFAFRILQAISGMQQELKSHLRNLQGLEFIYEKRLFPELEYIFKHALIQEVAYNSLLLKRRKAIHERIGLAIEQIYAERIEEFYAMLAHHFERAGIADKAVKYLQLAGERASRFSAYEEAIALLNRGLELLQTLPESRERDEQEIMLRLVLAPPLIAVGGWASPEMLRSNTRALDLCRRMGESPQIFPALWWLWNSYILRSEHQTSLGLAEQLLSLAQREQDPLHVAMAHWALGLNQLYMGEFASSLAHVEHMIRFYDPQQHRSVVFLLAMDPGVYSRTWAAWALWFMGYPDQALKRIQEAVALARETNHPLSLCFALAIAAEFHVFRRENRVAKDYANSFIQAALSKGFAMLEAFNLVVMGRLKMEDGLIEEGRNEMRQGLAALRAIGNEWTRPLSLAWLAQASAKGGQIEESLSLLEEALALIETGGERIWEAEVHRVTGELLQLSGKASEAETSFRQAIKVARRQEAKSWELRATLSLSRLLQKEGRSEEARGLLSEIYGWFTEGFDTPNLKEAKGLLEELGS